MTSFKLLFQYPYMQPNSSGELVPKLLDVIEIKQNKVTLERPIIALSDMQGLTREHTRWIPLGIDVFRNLLPILAIEKVIPNLAESACLIAGDMYASTTDFRMGLSGPIDEIVSLACESDFQSVSLVLGNHDLLSEHSENLLKNSRSTKLLDGDCRYLDNSTIGGISGIMGNPRKPNRNDEKMFVRKLEKVMKKSADILLLHEGPQISAEQIGNEFIRAQLLGLQNKLIISGHAHWHNPVAMLGNNLVINTDARIVVLQ